MTDYTPISCSFYDELEAAAVKHTVSTVVYLDGNETRTITERVVDFKTLDKEEFMIMQSGTTIRLDKIVTFNNLKPTDKSYCS